MAAAGNQAAFLQDGSNLVPPMGAGTQLPTQPGMLSPGGAPSAAGYL